MDSCRILICSDEEKEGNSCRPREGISEGIKSCAPEVLLFFLLKFNEYSVYLCLNEYGGLQCRCS